VPLGVWCETRRRPVRDRSVAGVIFCIIGSFRQIAKDIPITQYVPQGQSKSAVADFDINRVHRVSQRDVPWPAIGPAKGRTGRRARWQAPLGKGR
jgi:hypothetical protein